MKQQMRNHTVQYSFCLRIMTHKKQTNMEIVSIHSATQILWQYYGSSYHLTLLFLMSKENVVSSFLSTIDLILGVGQGAASYQSAALGRGNRSIKCLPPGSISLSFSAAAHLSKKSQTFCFLSVISWLVPPYNVAVLNFNFESLICNVVVFGGPLVTEKV